MKNKDKNRTTIFTSRLLMFGVSPVILLLTGIGLFTIIYEPLRTGINTLTWCITGFFCGVIPVLLLIFGARECFSVIRIDESGLKLLAYGFIKLMEIKWEEISEIRYQEKLVSPFVKAVLPFILISKTKSLTDSNISYTQNKKDALQIQMNKKIYDIIRKYSQQSINDLNEEKLSELKWN